MDSIGIISGATLGPGAPGYAEKKLLVERPLRAARKPIPPSANYLRPPQKQRRPPATVSTAILPTSAVESPTQPAAVPTRAPKPPGVSRVAAARKRRKETEIRALEDARRSRQDKECTVLQYMIDSKREFLKRLVTRKQFLHEENKNLAEEIVRVESEAMGRCHADLEETGMAVMSKSSHARQFQRDLAQAKEDLETAREEADAVETNATNVKAKMELSANQVVHTLKELLEYRQQGMVADEHYSQRLSVKIGTENDRLQQDLEQKRLKIQEAVEGYVRDSAVREDEVLSVTTDFTVSAMSPGTMSDAAVNADLRRAIEHQIEISKSLTDAICTLKLETTALNQEVAATAMSRGQPTGNSAAAITALLPSRATAPANNSLLEKMSSLALAEGFCSTVSR